MVAGYGSLHEVKRLWHIEDVAAAHDILDLREKAERDARNKAQSKNW